ncbi:MAG: hypothetical protein AB7K63_17325 [Vicinamibacterales bacterium]
MHDWTPRPLDGELEPWERQPGESEKAYAAFLAYRNLESGKRSIVKAAKAVGKSYHLLCRWSAQWSWLQRVGDYDRDLERQAHALVAKEIVDYRKRAAQQARNKAQILALPDTAIAQLLNKDREALASLSVGELLSLAIKAGQALPNILKAEALALGDITERPEEPTTKDDPLLEEIRKNDAARSHLAAALQQLGSGAGAAGGARRRGEPGPVEVGPAPDLPQSPAE